MENKNSLEAGKELATVTTECLAAVEATDGQSCVSCNGSGSVRNAERRWRTCDHCGGSGLRAAQSDGQSCSLCGLDHFELMRRALTQIYDYTGRDFPAIKHTAYMALPTTQCLSARAAVVHNEEK